MLKKERNFLWEQKSLFSKMVNKLKQVLKDIDRNNEQIDNLYAKMSSVKKVPKAVALEYERLLKRKNLLLDDLNRYI